jgi:hypothetical protein
MCIGERSCYMCIGERSCYKYNIFCLFLIFSIGFRNSFDSVVLLFSFNLVLLNRETRVHLLLKFKINGGYYNPKRNNAEAPYVANVSGLSIFDCPFDIL